MLQPDSKIWPALFIVILLLALAMRLYDLALDPPIAIGGRSQSLATDPAHITAFAASKVKFGSWELYDIPSWQVFKVSLSSLVAYIAFKIGKPDTLWTNLSGIATSFCGLFFFLLALFSQTRRKDPRYAVLAAFLLSSNFVYIIYNRFPLLESGLLLYSGIIFFLYQRYGHRLWNLALLGVLVTLSCLTGKIFGLAAGLAIILTIALGTSGKRTSRILVFAGSLLISAFVLLIILYGNRIGAYYSYLFEHAKVGEDELYILRGLREFYVVLFSYGTTTKLYRHAPFLFLSTYLILLLIILYARSALNVIRQNYLVLFSLLWLAAIVAMIAPFDYRPLRYSLLQYLPSCALLAFFPLLQAPDAATARPNKTRKVIFFTILLVLNHYFLIHFIIDLFWYDAYPEFALPIYYAALAGAILLTIILFINRITAFIFKYARFMIYVIAAFTIAALFFNGYHYYQWVSHRNHSFILNSRDFSVLLNDNALVAGPYAPRLCRETAYKSLVHYFGLAKGDKDIFKEFPITHVAIDKSNRTDAFRDFPELQRAIFLTDYIIRGKDVSIYLMPGNNPAYHPTDFEKASIFFARSNVDSALYYNERFLAAHPDNLAVHKQTVLIYFLASDYVAMIPVLAQIADEFPDNVDAQGFSAIYFKFLSHRVEQPDLSKRAHKALEKAKFFYYDQNDFLQQSFDLN